MASSISATNLDDALWWMALLSLQRLSIRKLYHCKICVGAVPSTPGLAPTCVPRRHQSAIRAMAPAQKQSPRQRKPQSPTAVRAREIWVPCQCHSSVYSAEIQAATKSVLAIVTCYLKHKYCCKRKDWSEKGKEITKQNVNPVQGILY